MRPGVEALHRRGVPRLRRIADPLPRLFALVAVLLWFAAPRALAEARERPLPAFPETRSEIHEQARHSRGLKHDVLIGLERRLNNLPSAAEAARFGRRDDPQGGRGGRRRSSSCSRAPRTGSSSGSVPSRCYFPCCRGGRRQKVVSETWKLIDLKLGAFVRGQLLLMLLVAHRPLAVFWLIGMPYWLLARSLRRHRRARPRTRPSRRRRRSRSPSASPTPGRQPSQEPSPCSPSGCSRTTS